MSGFSGTAADLRLTMQFAGFLEEVDLDGLRVVRHVKLARYMRMSPEEIGRTSIRTIHRYLETLKDVLDLEAKGSDIAAPQETDRS